MASALAQAVGNDPRDAYLDLLKCCLTASLYEESSWSLKRPSLAADRAEERYDLSGERPFLAPVP